jgi:hypothetical protein
LRDVAWDRSDVIVGLRDDIWRYLTQAARSEDEIALEASRLLQMSAADVRTLAQLHFVLSDEAASLLEQMPYLVRRLSTTTVNEREASAERVRGAIRWSETFSMRAASGLPHLFVTSPTRRAFDTPENQLLAFSLAAIARFGRLTGWQDSMSKGVGETVRARVNDATRWSRTRAISDLRTSPPPPKTVARVRAGRRRQLYAAAISLYGRYHAMIARLDRQAVRSAVENHALVTREDPVLLELLCAFTAVEALQKQGWTGRQPGLLSGGEIFSAGRNNQRLRLYYQHTPLGLSTGSLYRQVQNDHSFAAVGGLIPDLVLRVDGGPKGPRWLLIEVKGVKRSVSESARAAASDLLAYRRAFDAVLGLQPGPYGIGVAWGAGLEPSSAQDEMVLCSPDTLPEALAAVLGE